MSQNQNSSFAYINDLVLEQYLLNELPKEKMQAIEHQLTIDSQLQKRINDMKQSTEELMSQMPAQSFMKTLNNLNSKQKEQTNTQAKQTLESLSEKKSFFAFVKWFDMPMLSTAFSVFFVLAISFVVINQTSDNTDLGVRLKGEQAYFKLYRLGQEQQALNEQVTLKENDVLQLSYLAKGDQYGYLFSIDGNHVLTEHLVDGQTSALLNNNGEIQLDQAYQLDAAPLFERFIFISSEDPFDIADIQSSINQLIKDDAQFGKLTDYFDDKQFHLSSRLYLKEQTK